MTHSDTVFLIFHGRFPSEKAASIFAAKSAESFARQGKHVVLVVPDRKDRTVQDPFEYYGIEKNFDLAYVPIVNMFSWPLLKRFAFRVSFVSFAVSCVWYALRYARKADLFYSNESVPLFLLSFFFPRTCYEMHDFPERSLFFYKWLFRRVSHMLVHNKWKMEHVKEMMGGDMPKAFYEPNAVEISAFDIDISKEEARTQCGLPQDKKIVVYTGHLYGWKGVHVLAQAAALLPPDMLVVFVGGTTKDIEDFKTMYADIPAVFMAGHQPHTRMPVWQKAADVVVLPNTAKEKISAYYTSPMKLFEYMASKRPIVASRIPSITEIIDDTCAFLSTPDDPQHLADSIMYVLDHASEVEEKAARAFEKVCAHTWSKRASRIFSNIDTHHV